MKKLLCILTSLACMLSFAACGSSDDSSSSEKASVSSTADTSETAIGDEEDTTASETSSSQTTTKAKETSTKSTETETKSSNKTEPSTSADATTASNSSGSVVQPSSSSSSGSVSDPDDDDDDGDIFNFDKINVDKSGDTVVINIPDSMFGEDDFEDSLTYGSNTSFAAMVKKYSGAEVTKNDSKKLVTIKMPKKEYEKLMEDFRAEFEKALNEAVGSETYPYITNITHNSNFSEFDVYITTKEEFEENWGSMFFLTLYIESIYYYILDGNSIADAEEKGLDIDDILKITVHDQDGKTYSVDDFE